jgi:hypothetical protein
MHHLQALTTKSISLFCVINFQLFICKTSANAEWVAVPLRTKEEKEANILGGEGFQMVHSITYSESRPSNLFFGTDTSQIWKSIDGGDTWKSKKKGFYSHGARSIIVDPVNHNIVFAAGFLGQYHDKNKSYEEGLQGIYRSLNGGDNWDLVKKVGFYRQPAKGNLFAFDTTSQTLSKTMKIYAGSYKEGLLLSEDGGDTWNVIGLKNIIITDIKENPSKPEEIYVATEKGLYLVKNYSVKMLENNLPSWPRTIAISKNIPTIIYAAMGFSGIYRSFDGGYTFEKLNVNSNGNDTDFTNVAISPANDKYLFIKAHESKNRFPFYTHDAGISWHQSTSLETKYFFLKNDEEFWFAGPFSPHPKNPSIIFTVSNGRSKILKSLDGGHSWHYSGNGFTGGRCRDIGFDENGNMVFFLTDHGVWLTKNKGDTFKELIIPRFMDAKSARSGDIRGNTIIASIGTWRKKALAISHDMGKSWKYIDNYIDDFALVKFHPQKDNVIYAGKYRSDNKGESWKHIDYSIIAIYPSEGDIVYSVVEKSDENCSFLKSTDSGNFWNPFLPNCPFPAESIQEVVISPINENLIYVATGHGLWRYEDNHWTLKNEDHGLDKDFFGRTFISCLNIDTNYPHIIYAGRRSPGRGVSNGIFQSLDSGDTWKNISHNLGLNISIWSIEIDPNDNTVYIGTSLGTWKLINTDVEIAPNPPKNIRTK